MKYIIRRNACTSNSRVYRCIPTRKTNQNKYGMRNHSQKGIYSSKAQYMIWYSSTSTPRSANQNSKPNRGQ